MVFQHAGLMAICAALLSAYSTSGPTGSPRGRAFHDGVPATICLLKPMAGPDRALTSAELDSGIKAAFAAADINRDGWLDRAETQKLNAAKAGSCDRTPLIDWTGSGLIGINDFAAPYRTAFQRADIDQDGIVSAAELSARAPEPPPEDDKSQSKQRQGGRRGGGQPPP